MALPTPLRYEPVEALRPRTAARLPTSLQLSPIPVFYKALVLRLLAGTTRIKCNKTNETIRQYNNYSILGRTPNTRITKSILEAITTPVSLADYDKRIQATNAHNFSFYSEIYFEFCSYFFEQYRNNYLAAFVHLYRVLERVAYSFPMFWAARAKTYRQSFDTLKAYFNDPKIGELGVFKRFVPDFVDAASLRATFNINIVSAFPDWQKRHYDLLVQLGGNDVASSVPNSQVTIRYKIMIDLMIVVRNRYFHALTGHSNSFDSEQMVDANEFCSFLNEDLANWLAFILFQIFEFEFQ